jgi:hypothetical protein
MPTEAVRTGNIFPNATVMDIHGAMFTALKHMPGKKGGTRYRVSIISWSENWRDWIEFNNDIGDDKDINFIYWILRHQIVNTLSTLKY